MATIKSYSDLQQSKKLAEILPLESADMYYLRVLGDTYDDNGEIIPMSEDNSVPRVTTNCEFLYKKVDMFSCWSLAALLSILDFPSLTQNKEDEWEVCVLDHKSDGYINVLADNPVDACVAMIEKLHELNLL